MDAVLRRPGARAALLALALSPAARAQEPAPSSGGATVVSIEGPLDVGTLSLVRRAVGGALERGDRLVLRLDTPGGDVELMWQLARAVGEASDGGLLTAAWVDDRALSAGALVALACQRLYMRSHATIGSATAIAIGPAGPVPVSEDPGVREKFTSSFRSQFRAWAEERGRSGALAEAMVDPDLEVTLVRVDGELLLVSDKERADLHERGEVVQLVRTVVQRGELLSLTGGEALELELADGLAETLEDVLARVGCDGVVPTFVERARSEELAAWLDLLTPLLFIGGLVLAFLELKAPGFGVAGILSIACFAALLLGRWLVGLADVPQFVLVGAGVVLLAVEVFLLPGAIWPGALGGVCVLAGLVWAGIGSDALSHPFDRELALDRAFQGAVWTVLALAGMGLLSRWLPRTGPFERLVLAPEAAAGAPADAPGGVPGGALPAAGALGVALTALRPVGKVQLDGDPRQHEAQNPGGALAAGARVRVVEVGPAGRLVVEPTGSPAS